MPQSVMGFFWRIPMLIKTWISTFQYKPGSSDLTWMTSDLRSLPREARRRGAFWGRLSRGRKVQRIHQNLQTAPTQRPGRPHRHGMRPSIRILPGRVFLETNNIFVRQMHSWKVLFLIISGSSFERSSARLGTGLCSQGKLLAVFRISLGHK